MQKIIRGDYMIWEYESFRDRATPVCCFDDTNNIGKHRIHAHHNIEVIFMVSGKLQMYLYDLVGIDKEFVLTAGDIMVVNSNIVHSTTSIEHVVYYLAFLPPDLLLPSCRIGLGETPSAPLRDDGGIAFELARLMSEAFVSGKYPESVKGGLLNSLANSMMSILTPRLECYSIKLRGSNLKIDVIDYVYKNFRDPELTVGTLASAFGYSERRLNDIFHEQVGTSAKRYINDLRISDAAQKLLKTDLGIEAIGLESGFECLRTFLRAFKAKTGKTPTEYRVARGGK